MKVFKNLMTAFLLACSIGGYSQTYTNNLPDLHPPTPDAAAILKADQLGVSYTTGTPTFSIPLFNFPAGSYSLPISLNYSSAGVKVDEVASSVGMGWSLNAGGVVSRIIYDRPDEYRLSSNCNLNNIDPTQHNQVLLDLIEDAPDKESDIFTFSFPGGSGKFIIGLDGQPRQLTQLNMRIAVINSNFLNGFTITTDDGTEYQFTVAEITNSRQPFTDWGKTYDYNDFKTSWYLSKIILPGQSKWIDLQYANSNIEYESSIVQTLSKVNTTTWDCNSSNICPLGSTTYQTTVHRQITDSKFLTLIISSDGDQVSFGHGGRNDIKGGLYLYNIQWHNRHGTRIKWINLTSTHYNAINSNQPASNFYVAPYVADKRRFLQSIDIYGETNTNPLTYSFNYINPQALPPRLSYAQDIYGYYNGKTNNGSLIPILAPTDINYAAYPPTGSSSGSIQFGDRSVDTTKCKNGLLYSITYPTGGYDLITYRANRHNSQLAGGNSVSKISTYSAANVLASEKEFLYQNLDGSSSSLTLASNLLFSVLKKTYTDPCYPPNPDFPTCTHAVLTSNITNPLFPLGGQHLYYRSVIECNKDANGDNGITEHLYSYFMGGSLDPRPRLGDRILTAPFQIVPDFQRGETFTKIYRRNGANLELIKKTERSFRIDNLVEYYNYVINKKYDYNGPVYQNPPIEAQFLPYDMEQIYINCYTPRLEWTEETDYSINGTSSVKRTDYEYNNQNYTYPTKVSTTGSDNVVQRVERKYPPDIPANAFMVNRNIISPVLEEKTYKGAGQGTLLATKITQYKDWNNDGKVITPEWVNLILKNNPTGSKVIYHKYDIHGNVQELSKENDVHEVYLYGYKSTLPVARIVNSTFSVCSTYITQSVLDNPTSDADLRNHLNSLRSITGALVTTYTYEPHVGVTSETDANGRTSYYEYDYQNRLSVIRDKDNKVLKKICYNYAGQPENCETCVGNMTPEWQNSGGAVCEQGLCGNTGYQKQLQVDVNPCTNLPPQWVILGYNPTACAPETGVILTYENNLPVNFSTGFIAEYTNRVTGAFHQFYLPGNGTGQFGCIPAGSYILYIYKPGNNFPIQFSLGCGLGYQSGFSAFYGKITVGPTANCNSIIMNPDLQ